MLAGLAALAVAAADEPQIGSDELRKSLDLAAPSADLRRVVTSALRDPVFGEAGAYEGPADPTLYVVEVTSFWIEPELSIRESVLWTNTTGGAVNSVVFRVMPDLFAANTTLKSVKVGGKKRPTKLEGSLLTVKLNGKLDPGETVGIELVLDVQLPRDDKYDVYIPPDTDDYWKAPDAEEVVEKRDPNRCLLCSGVHANRALALLPQVARNVDGEWDRQAWTSPDHLPSFDPALFHVTFELPDQWLVASTGTRVSLRSLGAVFTGKGDIVLPMSRGLFVANGARSFGATLLDAAQHVPRPGTAGGTRIVVHGKHSRSELAEASLARAKSTVTWLSRTVGTIPPAEIELTITPFDANSSALQTSELLVLDPGEDETTEREDLVAVSAAVARQWWVDAAGTDPLSNDKVGDILSAWSARAVEELLRGEVRTDDADGDHDALLMPMLRDALGEARFQRALYDFFQSNLGSQGSLAGLLSSMRDQAIDPGVVDETHARWTGAKVPSDVRWGLERSAGSLPATRIDARESGLPVAWEDQHCRVRWPLDTRGVPEGVAVERCDDPWRSHVADLADSRPGAAEGDGPGPVSYYQDVTVQMAPSWVGATVAEKQYIQPSDTAGLSSLKTVLEVRKVFEGSPASADDGLRRGDVIRSVEGEKAYSPDIVWDAVRPMPAGGIITLEIERDGAPRTLKLRAATFPGAATFLKPAGPLAGLKQADGTAWTPSAKGEAKAMVMLFFDLDEPGMTVLGELLPLLDVEGLELGAVAFDTPKAIKQQFEPLGSRIPVASDPEANTLQDWPIHRLPAVAVVQEGSLVRLWQAGDDRRRMLEDIELLVAP